MLSKAKVNMRNLSRPLGTIEFSTGKQETEADAIASDKKWYALQVRRRLENIAAAHLAYKGYEQYLPLYRRRRRWADRIKEFDFPLFPGYIFCKFDVLQRLPVLLVPGIISIVGFGKNPLAVPDDEIYAVQNVAKSGLTFEPSDFISTGQLARVKRGPLHGLVGIVVAKQTNCRLVISVNLLQRSVAVTIDNYSVEPVNSCTEEG
jgi:transcriptional antiterminator NusG